MVLFKQAWSYLVTRLSPRVGCKFYEHEQRKKSSLSPIPEPQNQNLWGGAQAKIVYLPQAILIPAPS